MARVWRGWSSCRGSAVLGRVEAGAAGGVLVVEPPRGLAGVVARGVLGAVGHRVAVGLHGVAERLGAVDLVVANAGIAIIEMAVLARLQDAINRNVLADDENLTVSVPDVADTHPQYCRQQDNGIVSLPNRIAPINTSDDLFDFFGLPCRELPRDNNRLNRRLNCLF